MLMAPIFGAPLHHHPFVLRLRGGARFQENKKVSDVIMRVARKGNPPSPTDLELQIAKTLFELQVASDEYRMLKYLHIASARYPRLACLTSPERRR